MELTEDKQFIKRTRDNFQNYKGPYKVTLSVNSAIGLLFCGHELGILPQIDTNDLEITAWESTYTDRATNKDEPHNIKNLVRHIRNSIAHFRFSFKNENGNITGLIFTDQAPNNEKCKIEMPVQGFLNLVIKISDELVKE